MNLITLAYSSTATRHLSRIDLGDLLVAANKANGTADITGLLICTDDAFFQALEGPSVPVLALMGRIKKDARHQDVELVVEPGPIKERAFPNWAMLSNVAVHHASVARFLDRQLERGNLSAGQIDVLRRALALL